MKTQDEQAIRQVFQKMAAAWAAGDGAAYAELFTDNCDYVTFMGDHLRGKNANATAHQQLF